MELHKLRLQIISGIVLGVLWGVAQVQAIECFTPLEWQDKLGSRWNRDANGDNVDDVIFRSIVDRVDVLLDLNDCPTSADLERFAQYGTVGYVSQSISVVQLRGVRLADTLLLAQDERVAMVEWDASVHAGLHTGVAAMRVTASEVYSPDTVEDRYPGLIGLGVNIAFLDTGIDDGVHESLPASKFVGGFDVFTGQEGNPDDLGLGGGGHGTAVASAALGVGRFRGVAPGAGLIDIKVIPRAGAQGSSAGVLAGIDKCIEKRLAWNIGVMNLSLHQSIGLSALNLRQSNGLDALSQAVNRAVQEGIVAVVSVGNQRDPTIPVEDDVLIPAPAAADDGIAVGHSMGQGTISRSDDHAGFLSSVGPRLNDGDSETLDELKPDVAAPGCDVMVARADSPSGYGEVCGSSIAAGQVAGLAALILQKGPHLRPLEVRQRIIHTAEDIHPEPICGWAPHLGYGLVDALCAIGDTATSCASCICDPGQSTDLRADSIAAENPFIVSGVPNVLRGSVCNDGPAVAGSFQVRLSAYQLSDSEANYPACTVRVPAGLGVGDCTHVQCPWTPRVSGPFPGVVHACVKEEVVYACDTNGTNQYAQRNLEIHTSQGTSEFTTQIVNPAAEDLIMEVLARPSPACGGWSFTQSDFAFPMAAAQCGRAVDFSLTPQPGTTASCKVDVAVEGVRLDGTRRVFAGMTLLGAVPEPDPPLCALLGTGTDARGRKLITVLAQDTKSGLAGINVVKWQNASVRIPAFEPGGTGAVYVTATKLDPSLSSSTELDIIDAAGNIRRCDPLHVALDRQTGKPVTETFTGIPQAEHYLSVHNGTPGVTNLSVEVNGKKFQLGGLKPGEVRAMNLGSAMVAGNGNTVSLTALGKPGSEVVVLLHD